MRALIAEDRYFDRVEAFYATFSHDLTASNETILVEPQKINRVSVRSIDGILDALINFGRRGEKDFLIATHGNPQGLPIPLRAGSPVTMNHDIMDDLAAALGGSAAKRSALLSMVALGGGGQVFRNEGQLDALLAKLRAVRQQQIEHLEFRGCNIGAGPALRSVHRLLGARITDAPTVQFMWTSLSTAHIRTVSAAQFRADLRPLGPDRREFTASEIYRASAGADPDEVMVAIGITATTIRIAARSRDMVLGFAQSYLQDPILFALDQRPPGGGYRPGGRLPMVAFKTTSGRLPFVLPGDGFGYTDFLARQIELPRGFP
jgi:hypothetical protein